MIPDEAVEAAAFELYKDDWWGKPTSWPEPPFADDATLEDYKADYLKAARFALEAAAPHLMAAALNDAADAFENLPSHPGAPVAPWDRSTAVVRLRERAIRVTQAPTIPAEDPL